MKLHHNPASPYVRKVRVLAHEIGLSDRIELVARAMTPVAPDVALNADNPLGKIPTLLLDDGTALVDSRVICEYLDSLHQGRRMFPAEGPARWRALTLQALGDGILDAAVGTRYETFLRPGQLRWSDWIVNQELKWRRTLDRIEGDAEGFGNILDIGVITLACALGYLDFRFPEERWRSGRDVRAAWYLGFAARPSMQATLPE